MAAINSITPEKLTRLIGTPRSPTIIDVRTDEEFGAAPRLVPGSIRRPAESVTQGASDLARQNTVIICRDGRSLSEGVAAWLRHEGIPAETLDGGVTGWATTGLPMVPNAELPPRDTEGRSIWVTRARPKVDRIACPWLIRRFVDPNAVFFFVNPTEVAGVAERFAAAPFDVEGTGIVWSHDGDRCTFDVMIERLGLAGFPALAHLAVIVRAADTGRPDLAPEAAGLLALSLGLSRMFSDDVEQLDAGLLIYDALFRWCRDATGETHDWISHQPKAARARVPA